MRTFAQKPKASQQTASPKSTIPSRAHFGQSREVNSILHLQRTIGNQAVQRMLQTNAEELEEGLASTALPRFAYDFSQIPVHPRSQAIVQAKLTESPPGDIFEQEADYTPEQIMHMPEPKRQRACPCGGGCPKCQMGQPSQEHERWQPKRLQPDNLGQTAVPPIVDEVLASPGQPLDAATRTFMEPRFGYDFGRVRVHVSTRAAESAQAVNARAYTVGQHIVLGAGQPSPESLAGRLLLAHELAHVVQQSRDGPAPQLNPSAPHEREAHAAGRAVAAELPSVGITCHTGIALARNGGGDNERAAALAAAQAELDTWLRNPVLRDVVLRRLGQKAWPMDTRLPASAVAGLLGKIAAGDDDDAESAAILLGELRDIQDRLRALAGMPARGTPSKMTGPGTSRSTPTTSGPKSGSVPQKGGQTFRAGEPGALSALGGGVVALATVFGTFYLQRLAREYFAPKFKEAAEKLVIQAIETHRPRFNALIDSHRQEIQKARAAGHPVAVHGTVAYELVQTEFGVVMTKAEVVDRATHLSLEGGHIEVEWPIWKEGIGTLGTMAKRPQRWFGSLNFAIPLEALAPDVPSARAAKTPAPSPTD